MANKIILKRSSITAKVPLTTDLEYGELAINYADGKLYYKDSLNTIQAISGSGTSTLWNKKTASYTAVAGDKLLADTTSGTFTITLPATPAVGDSVIIADANSWNINNLTVARNGSTIETDTADVVLDIANIEIVRTKLLCDKKDMIQFFTDLKEKYTSISEFIHMFENYEITKLDINRIFRYLEKSITDTKLKDDEFLENENDDGYECENYDE